ncbi:hypothetical protein [Moorena producens]|uniref:hypothetical protein n=1 Tax=Moorena producens TaxID=1155739 RepID=UPI0011EA62A2|nr:hypothetical protein [Moorena producens]
MDLIPPNPRSQEGGLVGAIASTKLADLVATVFEQNYSLYRNHDVQMDPPKSPLKRETLRLIVVPHT